MVQRKVSNKFIIHPKNTLKTDKIHANSTPSLQNYDVKTKVVDMKAIKMKKSRSFKRPDVEFSRHSLMKSHEVVSTTVVTPTKTPSPKMKKLRSIKQPDLEFDSRYISKPGEISTFVTPAKTPSLKKQCFYDSPNYMKSTSSSEHHKAVKTLNKTSSLNKVRTLTKAPSFKHSQTTHKKAVLCENIDAQRATCSSTLKEFKFPSYLKLAPGATEAEGTSVMKVCPFNYCSLNGHRHSSAPPLKTFLASKRRMLKTLKHLKPEVVSPGKRKRCEIKVTNHDSDKVFMLSGESEMLEGKKDDFFVEIHVPGYDPAQVSDIGVQDDVNLSDKNFISEENGEEIAVTEDDSLMGLTLVDKKDDLLVDNDVSVYDLWDDVNISDMNFSSEENPNEENSLLLSEDEGSSDGYHNASDLEMESDSSVGLDQLFGQVSDMEWEEGQMLAFPDEKVELPIQKVCGDDEIEFGFELEKFVDGKMLPCIYDEIIMEFLQFSDADTASDTESALTDGDYIVEGSFQGEPSSFLNLIEEVTKAQIEGLDSFEEHNEANRDKSHIEIYMLGEEKKPTDFSVEDITSENIESEDIIHSNEENSQAEADQSDAENTEDASLVILNECLQPIDQNNFFLFKDASSEEEYDSTEVNFGSAQGYVEEVKTSEAEDLIKTEKEEELTININKPDQVYKGISDRGNDSIDELLDCSSKLRKSVRCKKTNEDSDEDKDFNPRPPNFLPVEPEQETEKVDLRHQDMDERRNAEDWMLDHALQRTVGQLAPARKRKVALLVEAFEAVIPIPKYGPHMRINSSGFTHARPVQACRG